MRFIRASEQDKSKTLGDLFQDDIQEFSGKKEASKSRKIDMSDLCNYDLSVHKFDREGTLASCDLKDNREFSPVGKTKIGGSIWGPGEIKRRDEDIENAIKKEASEQVERIHASEKEYADQYLSQAQSAYEGFEANKTSQTSAVENLEQIDNLSIFGKGITDEDAKAKTAGEELSEFKSKTSKIKDKSWMDIVSQNNINEIYNKRIDISY